MKVSYEESLASYFGLQRRGGSGDRSVLSVRAKGNAGQPLSSDITTFVCRSCPDREKATPSLPFMARHRRARRSLRPFGVFLWCLSDIVQIIRTQRCVVESAAQIRVAVFVKPSIAVLHLCVRFHVDAGQCLAALLVGHTNLPVIVRRLHSQRIRAVGSSLALALTDDCHKDISVSVDRTAQGLSSAAGREFMLPGYFSARR